MKRRENTSDIEKMGRHVRAAIRACRRYIRRNSGRRRRLHEVHAGDLSRCLHVLAVIDELIDGHLVLSCYLSNHRPKPLPDPKEAPAEWADLLRRFGLPPDAPQN